MILIPAIFAKRFLFKGFPILLSPRKRVIGSLTPIGFAQKLACVVPTGLITAVKPRA